MVFLEWFWHHDYWLPPGYTWEDMNDTDEVRYPHPHHLLLGIPFSLVLTGIRFIFERAVAVPLSQRLGLRERVRRRASPNPMLEAFYKRHNRGPKESELSGLAKRCDLQPRQVERWFRCRCDQDRPSLTRKFCEASWKSTFYFISTSMGLAILYDKPWFWDQLECWNGYPQQSLIPSIMSYYLLELSFYSSLFLTLPFDVKQKDLYLQAFHHAITILLICFSYCANYLRIGSLVIIIHDFANTVLEPTKIFHYLKWHRICDTLFIIFSAMFLFTRLVIFPYNVLYNTYYYSMELYQPFLGYYLMNAFLMFLQVLHIFWSCLIIKMIYRFILDGMVEKDVRSDSEESEKGDERTEQGKEEEERNGALCPPCDTNGSYLGQDARLQLRSRRNPNISQAGAR